ncbi:MAG: transposase [Cyanophyceae cyanobacterium]
MAIQPEPFPVRFVIGWCFIFSSGRRLSAIPFPERLQGKTLKEVRILPKCGAQWFDVELVTEAPTEPQTVNPANAAAVDLGLDNLAACVSTTGASMVINGKRLKSINQWYDKLNTKLQSAKDKQGIEHFTKRQSYLLRDRNNRVRDYLHKTARVIINWCINQRFGTLIVGVNPGWKQDINIGKRNNQSFLFTRCALSSPPCVKDTALSISSKRKAIRLKHLPSTKMNCLSTTQTTQLNRGSAGSGSSAGCIGVKKGI